MKRSELMQATASIRDHLYIADRFIHDRELSDEEVALEILGRCNLIDERLAELRAAVTSTGHVTGQREVSA